jgi:AraC family transcriptional regulator
MDVTLTTLPPARIAYLRHIGPYGEGVGRFWRETVLPWLVAEGLAGRPLYGIGRDDPKITEPAKCRYDAGVEVPDDFVARAPAVIGTLPGGRYAVMPFFGTSADMETAYTRLLREWLPASGMQMDGRPLFEYIPVDAKRDPQTGAFECRLCLGVRPA